MQIRVYVRLACVHRWAQQVPEIKGGKAQRLFGVLVQNTDSISYIAEMQGVVYDALRKNSFS